MSDLPTPLTPPECDLRGFEWMPLWGHRMFTSSWYRAARKDGRGGIASLKLYWVAMLQHPAGSLPNDEEELCMLADFGEDMRAWCKHRLVAMYGFVLCSDNRWYHPVVAEQVLNAYDRRLKAERNRDVDRERLRRWRERQNGSHPPEKPNGQAPPETPDETRFRPFGNALRNASETGRETSRATRGEESTRQETPPVGPHAVGTSTPAEPGTPPARRANGTNPRALGNNPRETGANPRANATNPRATKDNPRSRNPFHDKARKMDAELKAQGITIDGLPEAIVDFYEATGVRPRRIGGANG